MGSKMNRMDYSADDLEALLLDAYKRLEAARLIDMNDPIYKWLLAYNADIRDLTAAEALAAFARMPPKDRANIIAYVESNGKLPTKPRPAPPALVGHNPPMIKPVKPRKQHRKHSL